jgi:hypothetical protein
MSRIHERREELVDLKAFLAVAEHGSFTRELERDGRTLHVRVDG